MHTIYYLINKLFFFFLLLLIVLLLLYFDESLFLSLSLSLSLSLYSSLFLVVVVRGGTHVGQKSVQLLVLPDQSFVLRGQFALLFDQLL